MAYEVKYAVRPGRKLIYGHRMGMAISFYAVGSALSFAINLRHSGTEVTRFSTAIVLVCKTAVTSREYGLWDAMRSGRSGKPCKRFSRWRATLPFPKASILRGTKLKLATMKTPEYTESGQKLLESIRNVANKHRMCLSEDGLCLNQAGFSRLKM